MRYFAFPLGRWACNELQRLAYCLCEQLSLVPTAILETGRAATAECPLARYGGAGDQREG